MLQCGPGGAAVRSSDASVLPHVHPLHFHRLCSGLSAELKTTAAQTYPGSCLQAAWLALPYYYFPCDSLIRRIYDPGARGNMLLIDSNLLHLTFSASLAKTALPRCIFLGRRRTDLGYRKLLLEGSGSSQENCGLDLSFPISCKAPGVGCLP